MQAALQTVLLLARKNLKILHPVRGKKELIKAVAVELAQLQ